MRALVVASMLVAGSASAMCASANPIVLPLEGSTVPPDPVLYVFLPEGTTNLRSEVSSGQESLRELWVSSPEGAPLPFTLQRLEDGLISVYRLSVRAPVGAQFIVRPFQTAVSTVAQVEKATVLNVERGVEHNFRWTCSYESTRVLVPSLEAPAFRVTWGKELKDVDAPGAPSVIFPGLHAWLRQKGAQRVLKLGHPNCTFTTLAWSTPIFVRVTALMADGREVVGKQVLRLEPPPPFEALDQ